MIWKITNRTTCPPEYGDRRWAKVRLLITSTAHELGREFRSGSDIMALAD